MNQERVSLATIRRARGLKGEVFAEVTGTSPDCFQPGFQVQLVDGKHTRPATVESSWLHNGDLVLKFAGLDSRSDAENLRGLEICIPLEDRPVLPEGEYYLSDLIGFQVLTTEGRVVGEVRAWHDYGAAPLLEVWNGVTEVLVPFTVAFYRIVDLSARKIVVELPEGLEAINQT